MTLQKPTPLEKELLAENAMLRRKLSPMEDPEFTRQLAVELAEVDLMEFCRQYRKGGEYIVVEPKTIAKVCFGDEAPNLPLLTNIGRSLQALCWERSAINGRLVFVMSRKEYEDGRE